MSGHDWTEVVGAVGLFALITTVISVTVVQLAATWRAKVTLAREAEYRKLAEGAAQAQEATERRLAELGERFGQMQTRLASIERILEQVE
ncbi:UNVERIFIED_ORG: nitrate/nitrite-specific signal transduction histidine kinase [Microbispora rosea subsp. rosea]